MELPPLQQALNFTDADLAANRAGRLSDDQRKRLWRERSVIVTALLVGIAAVPALIFLLNVLPATQGQQLARDVMVLVMLEPLMIAVAAYKWYEYSIVLGGGRVSAVEGAVTLQGADMVLLFVDDLEFGFSLPDARRVFEGGEGQRYRIYYVPKWLTVMSAERIDAEQTKAE